MKQNIKFLLLLLFLPTPLAMAQSEGFHYLPSGPRGEKFEFGFVLLDAGAGVYRATGAGSSLMTGLGGVYHLHLLKDRFVSLQPQFGGYLFFGNPQDSTGGSRQRYSLQLPLALHYVIKLFRDDRLDKTKRAADFLFGIVVPLTFDFTPDGFNTSGDFGVQTGLSYTFPVGEAGVALQASIAQFFIGYFYQGDLANDDWSQIERRGQNISGGMQLSYGSWPVQLRPSFHWLRGLGSVAESSLLGGSVHLLWAVD